MRCRSGLLLCLLLTIATVGCGGDGSPTADETVAPATDAQATAAAGSGDADCVDPGERPLRLIGSFWFNPIKSPEAAQATPIESEIALPEAQNSILLVEQSDGTLTGTFTYIDITGDLRASFKGSDRREINATISAVKVGGAEGQQLNDDLGREVALTAIDVVFENPAYPQAKKCIYTGSITGGGVFRIGMDANGNVVRRPGDRTAEDTVLLRHLEIGGA